MIEEYLIHIIKHMNIENICLESNEDKTKWYFSCFIGKAYDRKSQEVWMEGNSPFGVLEEAITFISRYNRGCHVGKNKHSKWESMRGVDLMK